MPPSAPAVPIHTLRACAVCLELSNQLGLAYLILLLLTYCARRGTTTLYSSPGLVSFSEFRYTRYNLITCLITRVSIFLVCTRLFQGKKEKRRIRPTPLADSEKPSEVRTDDVTDYV